MHSEASGRIIGHVGKNPEISPTANGRRARFSICHNDGYYDQAGQWVERPQWFWVTAFEYTPKPGQTRPAKTLVQRIEERVRSGSYVLVDISLKPNSYSKGGVEIETVDLVIDRLRFLEPLEDGDRDND